MDNKRWYSRFGTIFWWSLAILPLIVALIYFIGYHLTFNSGITSASELALYHSNVSGNFDYALSIFVNSSLNECVLPYLYDMFDSLFYLFFGDNDYSYLTTLLGWMTSVAFYHILFDFAVWIFNWIHAFFDRWGCFK